MMLPNRSAATVDTKLPRVYMNLQTNRPPNLGQAHDARFESFNKEPDILSKVRKVPQVNLNKMERVDRHKCLINQDSHVSMQRYHISEELVKKRPAMGVSISKQLNWNQIVEPRKSEGPPPLESCDQIKVSTSKKRAQDSKCGIFSYAKQAPRKFGHF